MKHTIVNLQLAKDKLLKKTTIELSEILQFSQDDYQPEIIPLIESILTDRGVSDEELIGYKKRYQKLKSGINKASGIQYKTPVYITLILLGIGSTFYKTVVGNYKPVPTPKLSWTASYTDSIRAAILNSKGLEKVNSQYKNDFCECMIGRLKSLYPHKISTNFTSEKMYSLSDSCINKMR